MWQILRPLISVSKDAAYSAYSVSSTSLSNIPEGEGFSMGRDGQFADGYSKLRSYAFPAGGADGHLASSMKGHCGSVTVFF